MSDSNQKPNHTDPYRPPANATTESAAPDTNSNSDDVIINLQRMSADEATAAIEQFFNQEGYKLEEGQPNNGVYGIGNAVLRILFGAFVKRHKFKVLLTQLPSATDAWQVILRKGMSGASGGIIGYQKNKKEFLRLANQLTHFCQQQPDNTNKPSETD